VTCRACTQALAGRWANKNPETYEASGKAGAARRNGGGSGFLSSFPTIRSAPALHRILPVGHALRPVGSRAR